jgi:hypothetical protein
LFLAACIFLGIIGRLCIRNLGTLRILIISLPFIIHPDLIPPPPSPTSTHPALHHQGAKENLVSLLLGGGAASNGQKTPAADDSVGIKIAGMLSGFFNISFIACEIVCNELHTRFFRLFSICELSLSFLFLCF